MNPPLYHAAVFGATSAIATETLRALVSSRPSSLLLIGRHVDRLETLAADLRSRGAACRVLALDLLDPDIPWLQHLADTPWDLFLIAHGSLPDQESTLADPHHIGREIDINFISPVRIAAACTTILENQGTGTLAIFGSVAGDRGRASNYLYGSTKAGIDAFTSGLRHRFARFPGLRVVLLKPGMTDTPMTAAMPKGPLFSSAEKVGQLACKAILQGKAVAYLPGWWFIIMTLIRHLPRFLLHRTKL